MDIDELGILGAIRVIHTIEGVRGGVRPAIQGPGRRGWQSHNELEIQRAESIHETVYRPVIVEVGGPHTGWRRTPRHELKIQDKEAIDEPIEGAVSIRVSPAKVAEGWERAVDHQGGCGRTYTPAFF